MRKTTFLKLDNVNVRSDTAENVPLRYVLDQRFPLQVEHTHEKVGTIRRSLPLQLPVRVCVLHQVLRNLTPSRRASHCLKRLLFPQVSLHFIERMPYQKYVGFPKARHQRHALFILPTHVAGTARMRRRHYDELSHGKSFVFARLFHLFLQVECGF